MLIQSRLIFIALLALLLAGCETVYFEAAEKVGFHKRDIMVSRVTAAKESQEEAQKQFASALEAFSHELNFSGGDLEDKYKKLNGVYEDSVSGAEEVKNRIDKVESVSDALFDEWAQELKQYKNQSLRRSSEQKLRETKRRYKRFLSAMHAAEEKMEPVLAVLHDNVLYLKHNLNAMAIASLKGEVRNLEKDVDSLIREMEAAIKEADSFIASLK